MRRPKVVSIYKSLLLLLNLTLMVCNVWPNMCFGFIIVMNSSWKYQVRVAKNPQIFSIYLFMFTTSLWRTFNDPSGSDDGIVASNGDGLLMFTIVASVSLWMALWISYGIIMESKHMLNSVSLRLFGKLNCKSTETPLVSTFSPVCGCSLCGVVQQNCHRNIVAEPSGRIYAEPVRRSDGSVETPQNAFAILGHNPDDGMWAYVWWQWRQFIVCICLWFNSVWNWIVGSSNAVACMRLQIGPMFRCRHPAAVWAPLLSANVRSPQRIRKAAWQLCRKRPWMVSDGWRWWQTQRLPLSC